MLLSFHGQFCRQDSSTAHHIARSQQNVTIYKHVLDKRHKVTVTLHPALTHPRWTGLERRKKSRVQALRKATKKRNSFKVMQMEGKKGEEKVFWKGNRKSCGNTGAKFRRNILSGRCDRTYSRSGRMSQLLKPLRNCDYGLDPTQLWPGNKGHFHVPNCWWISQRGLWPLASPNKGMLISSDWRNSRKSGCSSHIPYMSTKNPLIPTRLLFHNLRIIES